jgi:hypothetical protein
MDVVSSPNDAINQWKAAFANHLSLLLGCLVGLLIASYLTIGPLHKYAVRLNGGALLSTEDYNKLLVQLQGLQTKELIDSDRHQVLLKNSSDLEKARNDLVERQQRISSDLDSSSKELASMKQRVVTCDQLPGWINIWQKHFVALQSEKDHLISSKVCSTDGHIVYQCDDATYKDKLDSIKEKIQLNERTFLSPFRDSLARCTIK